MAQQDRGLHLLLIIGLGTLGFNVLLNAVDGRLVRDQTLLNLVKAIVDLVLENHVAPRVVLHCVEGRLLGKASAVRANLLPDRLQALLLSLVRSLELTHSCELVSHVILHPVDVLGVDFHLLVHATFQVRDLVKVSTTSLNFNLKLCSSRFCLTELALLEVQILTHLFNLADTWKSSLSVQVLGHMLEEGHNSLLCVRHVGLKNLFLLLVLLGKVVDLLLLLVKHFKLLLAAHASTILRLVTQLILDVLDVTIVVVDHFSQVSNLLVLLLDLSIVLLNAVHKALSGLWERQVKLIALQLEILLALLELSLLFTQVLSALLERVLLETVLGILQTLANLFELLSLNADLVRESVVFLLQFLVLVALFWVQVVKACLVRKVDIVDLLLIGVKLVLHISLLGEESVQV